MSSSSYVTYGKPCGCRMRVVIEYNEKTYDEHEEWQTLCHEHEAQQQVRYLETVALRQQIQVLQQHLNQLERQSLTVWTQGWEKE